MEKSLRRTMFVLVCAIFASTAMAGQSELGVGWWVADFPGNQCGVLTVLPTGVMTYRTGADCSTNPPTGGEQYVAQSVRRQGDTISFDVATFEITKITPSKITGNWTLFDYKHSGLKFVKQ